MPSSPTQRRAKSTFRPPRPTHEPKKRHEITVPEPIYHAFPVDESELELGRDETIPPPPMDSDPPTKEEIRSMWEDYKQTQLRVLNIAERMTSAQRLRSDKIRLIAERMGKGPFEYEEKILQIRKRGSRWFLSKSETSKSPRLNK